MELTLDIGNTASKATVFYKDKIRWTRSYKNLVLGDLKSIFQKYPIEAVILSSVVTTKKSLVRFLGSGSNFVMLTSTTKVPLKNRYKTPATLGSDRLAAAAGAAKLFPKKNVLVIDAGTCIKYDFVTAKREYLGGSISPGLRMRFLSLHNFTDRLPLIEPEPIRDFTGTSTKNSIVTGVEHGIVSEINGFIALYKKRHGSIKVVLSGGDAPLFAGHIKSSIFAAPNLIHIGLHEILKHNVERT